MSLPLISAELQLRRAVDDGIEDFIGEHIPQPDVALAGDVGALVQHRANGAQQIKVFVRIFSFFNNFEQFRDRPDRPGRSLNGDDDVIRRG